MLAKDRCQCLESTADHHILVVTPNLIQTLALSSAMVDLWPLLSDGETITFLGSSTASLRLARANRGASSRDVACVRSRTSAGQRRPHFEWGWQSVHSSLCALQSCSRHAVILSASKVPSCHFSRTCEKALLLMPEVQAFAIGPCHPASRVSAQG